MFWALGSGAADAQSAGPSSTLDQTTHTGIFPGLGVHAGEPQKLSVAAGVVLREEWQSPHRDHSRAVALMVEPGLAAGRAAFDYVEGFRTLGSGFGVGPSVLRTWRDPWVASPNTTYAGGELMIWPIFHAGPRIGVYHSVSANDPARQWLVSLDVGVGM
jgi:hypothetical protein